MHPKEIVFPYFLRNLLCFQKFCPTPMTTATLYQVSAAKKGLYKL